MKRAIPLLMLATSICPAANAAEKKILVYTRNFVTNGKGYVHDNIAASVEAIRKMGAENGFAVDASDDPKVFTPANLKQYKALVFSNSNNEAFENDAQSDAFKGYIQAGGGLAGIHIASGSERNWEYYQSAIGGKFFRHPKIQSFTVRVTDTKHPSTRNIPAQFDWSDECYYHKPLKAGVHVLLVTDPHKLVDPDKAEYPGDLFGDSMPLAWWQRFDGGREWFTALGHKKEDYANPILYKHILGGILWAMGERQ